MKVIAPWPSHPEEKKTLSGKGCEKRTIHDMSLLITLAPEDVCLEDDCFLYGASNSSTWLLVSDSFSECRAWYCWWIHHLPFDFEDSEVLNSSSFSSYRSPNRVVIFSPTHKKVILNLPAKKQKDLYNLYYPKNPWTLQWKGLNLYSRGPGPQNHHSWGVRILRVVVKPIKNGICPDQD